MGEGQTKPNDHTIDQFRVEGEKTLHNERGEYKREQSED